MQWAVIIVLVMAALFGAFKVYAPVDDEIHEIPDTGEQPIIVTEDILVHDVSGTVLDMSGQGLTSVPMNVFDRTGLVGLDLSGNQLTGALQAEVRHLSNLEVLDLSDNQFTGVPAEVGQLSKLKKLDLSGNQLTGLPHEIGNLKNLEILDLRGNTPSRFDLDIIREGLPNTTILE